MLLEKRFQNYIQTDFNLECLFFYKLYKINFFLFSESICELIVYFVIYSVSLFFALILTRGEYVDKVASQYFQKL